MHKIGDTVSFRTFFKGYDLYARKTVIISGKIIDEYGSFYLLQLENYKECVLKRDVI